MRAFSQTIVLVALVGSSVLWTPAAGSASAANTRAGSYASGFRAAYLPVWKTLGNVSKACPGPRTVAELPACGARVAPFRTALAGLYKYVTTTPPPAAAKADVRRFAASIRVLQQRFATLAGYIKQKNLTRFLAMGGENSPIRNAIGAFVTGLGTVVVDVPGLRVPVPTGSGGDIAHGGASRAGRSSAPQVSSRRAASLRPGRGPDHAPRPARGRAAPGRALR